MPFRSELRVLRLAPRVLCGERLGKLERDLRRDARIVGLKAELLLLVGAGRIVAELGNAVRDVGPDRAKLEEIFLEYDLAGLANADRVRLVECADAGRHGIELVRAQ